MKSEIGINSRLPSVFRKFLDQFSGIQDFDGIKILSIDEIAEELNDDLFKQSFSLETVPFGKYIDEYSYSVIDSKGQVYILDHDAERLRYKYPDFIAFILLYSLRYVQNPRVYEALNLSSSETEQRADYFEKLIMKKLHTFGFIFDPEWTPN